MNQPDLVLELLAPPPRAAFPASPVAFPTRFPFRFGRFVVRRRLGAGGCGVVFLADDPVLGRAVALKLPRPETLISPELHGRFLREAQAAAVLSHPNIIPVFEADAVGGLCYTASEYCPGPTLAQWSEALGRPVPVADAAETVAALAAGIGYAHRRGVVHRDLKPSNVLLAPRGEAGTGALSEFVPLIADFGFAKLLEGDLAATASGVVIGTPLYMAPEQAEGRAAAIGPPTDVYALGAVLYELLTGRPPLVGTSTPDTLRRIVTDDTRAPRESRPDVPRALAAICLKCLEKGPARRYPDGDALAADLARFLAGSPTQARPVSVPARAAMWARRNPLVAALAALVVVTLTLVAGRESVHRSELGAQNAALRDALNREQAATADADRQREVAVDRYRVLRRRTYLAEIRQAAAQIDRGLLTDRSVGAWEPEYGDDFRGFEWAYLTRLARGTRTWAPQRAPVEVGPVSDDGRWCATVAGRDVRIWEVGTGRAVAEWTHPADLDSLVAVSADGWYAAAATRGIQDGVLLFGRGNREPRLIRGASGAPERFWSVGFAGADHLLVGVARAVRMHHTSNGALVRAFEGSDPLTAFGIGPGGGTLAAGFGTASGGHAVLYDVASGRELGRRSLSTFARHLAISADGRHVLISTERELRVWDVGGGRQRTGFDFPPGCAVKAVGRLTDGRLAAMSWPDVTGERGIALAIWDPRNDRWTSSRVVPPCLVNHAQFRPDGRGLLVGGWDSTLHEMDLLRPAPEVGWPVSVPAEAWAVAVSPDGRTLVTGGDDHAVRVWDARSGSRLAERTDHQSLVTSAAFAPDGRWFATGSFDGRVVIRDSATAAPRRVLSHGAKVRALAVSPDGGLIAATGAGGAVSVWDVASGLRLHRLEGAAVIYVLLFDRDGALITAPKETELVWFDMSTGRRTRTVPLPLRPSCLALAPDGRGLAVGFETGQIVGLDAAGARAGSWEGGPHSRLNALAFSPIGRTLAAAADDGSVLLYQAGTGDVLFALTRLSPPVHGLAFAPDGSFLAAARHDGRLAVWPADTRPATR